ncbi:MAG TPA: hypothetical protein VF157_03150 [Chloroflexota bacterium]
MSSILAPDWSAIRHAAPITTTTDSYEELRTRAGRISDFGVDTWVYFDNDQEGFAVENASI